MSCFPPIPSDWVSDGCGKSTTTEACSTRYQAVGLGARACGAGLPHPVCHVVGSPSSVSGAFIQARQRAIRRRSGQVRFPHGSTSVSPGFAAYLARPTCEACCDYPICHRLSRWSSVGAVTQAYGEQDDKEDLARFPQHQGKDRSGARTTKIGARVGVQKTPRSP